MWELRPMPGLWLRPCGMDCRSMGHLLVTMIRGLKMGLSLCG